jgi:GNAT superfamily N-acetyltransferase
MPSIRIRPATESDTAQILAFIRALADYEKLTHEVVATEADIRAGLFGAKPVAECVIAEWEGRPAGFALFFHNFSTFIGKPGIYLEDLFVLPELREKGIGRALLAHLAKLTCERACARLEWAVLDWNAPAIGFYRALGAVPMDEWTVNRMTGDALKRLADLAN